MKFLTAIIILLGTHFAFADNGCSIKSFDTIIKINKVLDESVIKASDCSGEVKTQFIDFLSAADGEISSRYVNMYFKSEFNKHVELKPNKINVKKLSNFIEASLNFPDTLIIDKVSSLYSQASLNLKRKSSINVSCTTCTNSGDKNILLTINRKKHWISASLKSLRHAYVLNNDINFFKKNISSNDIRPQIIKDTGRTNLFTDIKNLKFYRITKNLRKNDVLRVSDLSAKTIIRVGQKVQVLLKSKGVSLKTSAIARRSGKLGEFIQLYNPKSKKNIQAKIINFNKALIEL